VDTLEEAKAAFQAASAASAIGGMSGRDMLNLSLSGHDPGCVKTHTECGNPLRRSSLGRTTQGGDCRIDHFGHFAGSTLIHVKTLGSRPGMKSQGGRHNRSREKEDLHAKTRTYAVDSRRSHDLGH
jgi:hypothetical protein